ncbi:MAG: hypothetical protein IPN76_25435 [Saprospiraceae bacterium]|nr:hypothetical protein [Saprospiraceae bacterium]
MKFEQLHTGTNCNCIKNAEENTIQVFARKIGSAILQTEDFFSHWEKGIFPNDLKDCQKVCLHKGLSMNLWNESSRHQVLEKYLNTFRFAPKYKNCILVFQAKENAGFIEPTPNGRDPFHFTFFKSDDFSINLLDVLEIFPLENLES